MMGMGGMDGGFGNMGGGQPPPQDKGKAKGKDDKGPRINASFSSMPATECIGAGRIEGWFATGSLRAESKGFGHVESYCFEGHLFFHLQRSPWLRGISYNQKDPITFEVVEVNGKCEAVKLLTPAQVEELEKTGRLGKESEGMGDGTMPKPQAMIGQRVEGVVKGHYSLVRQQNWGFVSSPEFEGKLFFHLSENPEMLEAEFDRDDVVI